MATEQNQHSTQADFDTLRSHARAMKTGVWASYAEDVLDAVARIEEQLDREQHVGELLDSANEALKTRNAELVEQLEAARDWYRDHVNGEGWYDESMWGDPFAISPQLRAALTSNPASTRDNEA